MACLWRIIHYSTLSPPSFLYSFKTKFHFYPGNTRTSLKESRNCSSERLPLKNGSCQGVQETEPGKTIGCKWIHWEVFPREH